MFQMTQRKNTGLRRAKRTIEIQFFNKKGDQIELFLLRWSVRAPSTKILRRNHLLRHCENILSKHIRYSGSLPHGLTASERALDQQKMDKITKMWELDGRISTNARLEPIFRQLTSKH